MVLPETYLLTDGYTVPGHRHGIQDFIFEYRIKDFIFVFAFEW
jgi:hypothetical protein